jgi:maltooligosyltrehalose trehalohydrolase
MNERQFGPRLTADGASFRLWAPAAKRVDLLLEKSQAMRRGEDGWFAADIPGVKAGAHYKFRIDDEIDVPDPASDFQPDDVSGPSEVIDHASYKWRAREWRGRPWQETVLTETHVGTFTPDGTYRAMIGKLDHLKATGITAPTTGCRRCAPSPSRMRCIGCASIVSTGCGSTPCIPSPNSAKSRCCAI